MPFFSSFGHYNYITQVYVHFQTLPGKIFYSAFFFIEILFCIVHYHSSRFIMYEYPQMIISFFSRSQIWSEEANCNIVEHNILKISLVSSNRKSTQNPLYNHYLLNSSLVSTDGCWARLWWRTPTLDQQEHVYWSKRRVRWYSYGFIAAYVQHYYSQFEGLTDVMGFQRRVIWKNSFDLNKC